MILKSNPDISRTDLLLICSSRSVINFPEKLCKTTPILLLHGTADERVSYYDSQNLSARLTDLKHEHKLVLFNGGDHFLKSHRKEVDLLRREWFDSYLR
jgi:predicted esterase